jgi:hypothetical protein
MGRRLRTEVFDYYRGPHAQKLWLLAWADLADDETRTGWIPREDLAHILGFRHSASVARITRGLEAEGVIKRVRGHNRHRSALYWLAPLNGDGRPARPSTQRRLDRERGQLDGPPKVAPAAPTGLPKVARSAPTGEIEDGLRSVGGDGGTYEIEAGWPDDFPKVPPNGTYEDEEDEDL